MYDLKGAGIEIPFSPYPNGAHFVYVMLRIRPIEQGARHEVRVALIGDDGREIAYGTHPFVPTRFQAIARAPKCLTCSSSTFGVRRFLALAATRSRLARTGVRSGRPTSKQSDVGSPIRGSAASRRQLKHVGPMRLRPIGARAGFRPNKDAPDAT